MFKEIKKMLKDTLCNKSGKYSRKSLTMFASFQVSIVIAGLIIYGETQGVKFESAITIFLTFIGMAGFQTGASVVDKIKNPGNSLPTE